MRFFIRDPKNSWFKRLIFFYIALGIVIAIHKGVKIPPAQHQSKQAQDQTLRVKTSVNNSVSDKLKAQKNNYPPQLLFDTPDLTGQAEITSGVTFSLITLIDEPGRSRIVRHIRLYGVDTCEPRQPAIYNNLKWPCGAVATAWLVSRTFNKILFCRASTVRSGVHYAQCTVDGKDLAALGLAAGMMITTTKADFPLPKQYYEIEKTAKENKIGMWSSQFINPDKWRVDNGNYNPFDPR